MKVILTVNAGSSSIKFAIYAEEQLKLIYSGSVSNLLEVPLFKLYNEAKLIAEQSLAETGHANAIRQLVEWISLHCKEMEISAVSHRVVHGGRQYSAPVIITAAVVQELEKLIPLAPLHQPYNVEAIKVMMTSFPKAKQVACFDTAFHTTGNPLGKLYALPRKYIEEGVMRYGFHGLSYEYGSQPC